MSSVRRQSADGFDRPPWMVEMPAMHGAIAGRLASSGGGYGRARDQARKSSHQGRGHSHRNGTAAAARRAQVRIRVAKLVRRLVSESRAQPGHHEDGAERRNTEAMDCFHEE